MIVSKLSHHAPYGFEKAFAFLKTADTLPAGRYPIDGDNLFAIVEEYVPRPLSETQFEAHRRYIDIQYLLSGCERMDASPVEDMSVTVPYNKEKDVLFLAGEAKATLVLKEGEFAVFYPRDAHRPGIALENKEGPVKKVIVKILCPEDCQ